MATGETKLSIKLLIDSKSKKVLFAEVGKDFVDFLFHILSLPLSAVTNLLKEKGMNGCLSNLYQSVENFSDTHIHSKDIILKPECPAGISSVPFQLFNYFPTQKVSYRCSNKSKCHFASYTPYTPCPTCNTSISIRQVYVAPPVDDSLNGFVKELQVNYMVMDDLVVKPMSAVSSIAGLKDYNVIDVRELHEEVVQFGREEALKLLKLSLESKTVLTSLFVSQVKVEK